MTKISSPRTVPALHQHMLISRTASEKRASLVAIVYARFLRQRLSPLLVASTSLMHVRSDLPYNVLEKFTCWI